jgi:hypothetical protein
MSKIGQKTRENLRHLNGRESGLLSKIEPEIGGNWRRLNGRELDTYVYIKNSNYNFE